MNYLENNAAYQRRLGGAIEVAPAEVTTNENNYWPVAINLLIFAAGAICVYQMMQASKQTYVYNNYYYQLPMAKEGKRVG